MGSGSVTLIGEAGGGGRRSRRASGVLWGGRNHVGEGASGAAASSGEAAGSGNVACIGGAGGLTLPVASPGPAATAWAEAR